MADEAEFVVPIQAGQEHSVAATKTVIGSMAAGAELVAELAEDRALRSALDRLPGRLSRALALDWPGAFPDVPHEAVNGDARTACDFDTPSLNGIASSPPYLHDGSAPTLRDAILKMPGAPTSDDDVAALVEYLRSL